MPSNNNPHASLAVFNPTETRLQSRCSSQCFKQFKIARRPPCRHMQSAVAFAFKQNSQMTCNTQSDVFAQCTCNAMENCFKHRKIHAAKLSIHSLFFLTFSLLSFENQAA